MKNKKKLIIFGIIIIIIVAIVAWIVFVNSNNKQTETNPIDISYAEEQNEEDEDTEQIAEIIEEQSLEADESIYELDTEYDGREVVVVKASVSYNVALAGIIKKDMPEFSEIDEILTQAPTHTGIWIEEDSRESILKILNSIGNGSYEIDEQGYLIQTYSWNANSYDERIKELLTDDMLHIFCISSTTYLVDDVTGEITEYPFEQMDPGTEYEYFVADQKEIFIISEGNLGEVNTQDIIKAILETE